MLNVNKMNDVFVTWSLVKLDKPFDTDNVIDARYEISGTTADGTFTEYGHDIKQAEHNLFVMLTDFLVNN